MVPLGGEGRTEQGADACLSWRAPTVGADSKARGAKGNTMEQVPHWLMATVFAAGMTAYAEEVDLQLNGVPISSEAAPPESPDSFH